MEASANSDWFKDSLFNRHSKYTEYIHCEHANDLNESINAYRDLFQQCFNNNSTPVVLVPKKNGSVCYFSFCKLDQVTELDAEPMSNMEVIN